MLTPEIEARLNDINAHVEAVAVNNQPLTDLNTLAHAVHNLISVIRDIAKQPAEPARLG
jgi:hypothetical protein